MQSTKKIISCPQTGLMIVLPKFVHITGPLWTYEFWNSELIKAFDFNSKGFRTFLLAVWEP